MTDKHESYILRENCDPYDRFSEALSRARAFQATRRKHLALKWAFKALGRASAYGARRQANELIDEIMK